MSTKQTTQESGLSIKTTDVWILRDAKSDSHWIHNPIVRDTEAELKQFMKSCNVTSGEVYLDSELQYKVEGL